MSARRLSTANALSYPMYVLPCKHLVDMDPATQFGGVVPCHQQLLAAGLLVQWEPSLSLGPVAFVSHQWMGHDHADRHFRQLAVLQTVIRRIHSGELSRIPLHWIMEMTYNTKRSTVLDQAVLQEWVTEGYLWFDYFSIPQSVGYVFDPGPSLMDAVNSIPAYIEFSDHFIVLCPPLEHENSLDEGLPAIVDYASWSLRGWCRAEACVRLLARNSGPLIVIDTAAGTPVLMPAFEAWNSTPGSGMYTCCERDHCFQRTRSDGSVEMVSVGCDKHKIASIMYNLVDTKLRTLRLELVRARTEGAEAERSVLFDLRWIQAVRFHMLAGLHTGTESTMVGDEGNDAAGNMSPEEACRQFLRENHFDTETVNGSEAEHRAGLTPLLFAAMSSNVPAATELLRRGAEVQAPLAEDNHEVYLMAGRTVLHQAAQYGRREMVSLLLRHGADPRAVDRAGQGAPEFACMGADVENLRELLDAEPELMGRRGHFGHTLLMVALTCNSGRNGGDCVRELLKRGASGDDSLVQGLGFTTLLEAAVAKRGSRGVLRAFLQHGEGVEVDRQTRLRDVKALVLGMWGAAHALRWLDQHLFRRPSASWVTEFSNTATGTTALMGAAVHGSVPLARELLAAGADPRLRDHKGRTARDVAAARGYELLARVLGEAEEAWAVKAGDETRR